jgi:hypothetical protein
MTSNMKVLTLEKKICMCKHNEPVYIDSIHHPTSEIIQSVTILTEAMYIGISSLIPIAKKILVRYHSIVI